MANISTYPLGTPAVGDMIPATQTTTDVNGKILNLTKNFTVGNIAAFANSYSLGYTVYTAVLEASAGLAPTVTILQNTTGQTVTWTRTGTGTYLGTLSGTAAEAKFWGNSGGQKNPGMIDMLWISTTTVRVTSWTSSDGVALDELTAASIEFRIYS